MKVYHGTSVSSLNGILEQGIDLSKSQKYLDFGSGFYTSTSYDTAECTANNKCIRPNRFNASNSSYVEEHPCVIEFDLNSNPNMKKLEFDSPTKAWAMFVATNRSMIDSDRVTRHHNFDGKYDIVEGPIADGKNLTNTMQLVKKGLKIIEDIEPEDFAPSAKYEWGWQISFHSKVSLYCLTSTLVVYYLKGGDEHV